MFKPLLLQFNNQSVQVNQFGGGLISYQIHEGNRIREIIYSYDEHTKTGSMGDVLFPFPGRVKDAQYEFEGTHYQLQDVSMNGSNAIHGFAAKQEWRVVRQDNQSLVLSFHISEEEGEAKGYPFSLTLELTYSLDEKGLTVKSVVTNTGGKKAPFGLGFHPYYRLGTEAVNEISIMLSAEKVAEFNNALEPTGRLQNISEVGIQPHMATAIDDLVLDNCFTNLEYRNGIAEVRLSSNEDAITVWQDENFPYLQVYTSDTLPQDHYRKGVAVEAQTCTGFALNYPEMGLRVLSPGEIFEGKWGITI